MAYDANDIARAHGPNGVRRSFNSAPIEPDPNAVHEPPRFLLVPFNDLRIGLEPNYLIKGLLPSSGLALIYGAPKCGKSFFAFDMMMHVALGRPYRERRVCQGSVVYLALEGAEGFKARAEGFRSKNPDAAKAPPFYLVATPVNLVADHAGLIESITGQLAAGKLVAVVIDTLNRSLPGSESKDEDMAAYVRAADVIRDALGCLVVIIHHSGVDPRRPRGHTSLTGAADVQIKIERDGNGNVIAIVEFMKDGPEGAVIVSHLEPIEVGRDTDGDPISSCVVTAVEDPPALAKKPQKAPRLTASARVALKALRKALAEVGQPAPASNHIPANVKVVDIDTWREYAYRAGVSDSKEPRARQQAFKRARDTLSASEPPAVVVWDEHAWIAT